MLLMSMMNQAVANPPDRISSPDDDNRPCSGFFLLCRCTLVTLDGPPFRSTCSISLHRVCNMAIVTNGWCRSEPGPYRNQLRQGVFNTGGAAQKSAGLVDLMFDNKLNVMAVSEPWISESAPDSVKYGLAPTSYNISHVHRSEVPGGPTRGSSLAITTTSCRPPCALRRSS